jgi:hypothetical protein
MSKYQKDCKTLHQMEAYIRKTYSHPDWRFERFEISGITPNGDTIRLKWDRKDIGHKAEAVATV